MLNVCIKLSYIVCQGFSTQTLRVKTRQAMLMHPVVFACCMCVHVHVLVCVLRLFACHCLYGCACGVNARPLRLASRLSPALCAHSTMTHEVNLCYSSHLRPSLRLHPWGRGKHITCKDREKDNDNQMTGLCSALCIYFLLTCNFARLHRRTDQVCAFFVSCLPPRL